MGVDEPRLHGVLSLALLGDLGKFYSGVRWSNWKQDLSMLSRDRCYSFYPPLWAKEGAAETSHRATVSAEEAFTFKTETLRQL